MRRLGRPLILNLARHASDYNSSFTYKKVERSQALKAKSDEWICECTSVSHRYLNFPTSRFDLPRALYRCTVLKNEGSVDT